MRNIVMGLLMFFFSMTPLLGNSSYCIKILHDQTPITVNESKASFAKYTAGEGDVFEVIKESDQFVYIKINQKESGWISKESVSFLTNHQEEIMAPKLTKITASSVTEQQTSTTTIQEAFLYPRRPQNKNLNLDIDGFFESKLSGRDYSPKSVLDPRFETIIRDPIYNKLPKDVLLGPLKFDMRFKVAINGKIDEDTSVNFDIQKETDMPEKYDVQVKYKTHELTFHHLNAEFKNGEFINVNKQLTGMKYMGSGQNWEAIFAIGKERSEPKKFETNGSGSDKYRLGNSYILEGSVQVWVNNALLTEGVDYTVNYFDGEIQFKKYPQREDYIKIIYEFTNPIEDFLPVLSRKNFLGMQFLWKSKTKQVMKKEVQEEKETLWAIKKNLPSLLRSDEATANPTANVEVNNQAVAIHEKPLEEMSTQDIKEDLVTKNVLSPLVFYLNHPYLLLGSEKAMIDETVLDKNKEYFINYSEGKFKLANPIHQGRLTLSYKYYKIEDISEELIGKDTTGPYFLKRKNIIDATTQIKVNGLEKKEILDYVIDYDLGKLYFNYKIPYPSLISATYKAIVTTLTTEDAKQMPLELGVTYLNEYAKSQKEELTLSVTSENVTVSDGNLITLSQNPLINTADIKLQVADQLLPSTDYEILSAYKGILKLKNNASGQPAKISYKYRKSFTTTFIFQGITSKAGAAYLNGENGFVIRDLPMKYKGLKYILIQDGTVSKKLENPLDRNVNYSVDYSEDGQSIKIQFLKKGDNNNPDAMLDFYPNDSHRLTLFYDYSPPESMDPGDVNQTVLGFTVSKSLSKKWAVKTEIVGTNHNYSKQQVDFIAPNMVGKSDPNAEYSLGKNNIVENSELIFLDKRLLTKDKDYIINYVVGMLKFRNINPGPENVIEAQFKYFDSGSKTFVGENKAYKFATKFSTEYKTDHVQWVNSYKYIDKNFLAISPIQDKKGSYSYNTALDWAVTKNNKLNFSYRRSNLMIGYSDDNQDRYQVEDDFKTSLNWRFFDYLDTQSNFRYNLVLDDPNNTKGEILRNTDILNYGYGVSAGFGPEWIRQNFSQSFSESIQDYIDNKQPSFSKSNAFEYGSVMKFSKLPLIKNLSLSPKYYFSKNTLEQKISPTESYTLRNKYTLEGGTSPFEGLKIDGNYSFESIANKASVVSTENMNTIANKGYSVVFIPYTWLNSGFRYNLSESESPISGQKGLIKQYDVLDIQRFSFYGALTQAGVSHYNPILKPFDQSYISLSLRNDNSQENNGLVFSNGKTQSYYYFNFEPFQGIKLNKFSFEKNNAENFNGIQTSTSSENRSIRAYEKKSFLINVTPRQRILNLFAYSLELTDILENRTSKAISKYVTTNIIQEDMPAYTRLQRIDFKPNPFILTGKKNRNLGSLSLYAQENFQDLNNKKTTDYLSPAQVVVTTDISIDSQLSKTYVYGGVLSPFNLFSISEKITSTDIFLVRNIALVKGLTVKEAKNFDYLLSYSPFSFLNLEGFLIDDRQTQFTSPSLDATVTALKDKAKTRTYSKDFLDTYKNTYNTKRGAKATLTPFSFLSLIGSLSEADIEEQYDTVSLLSNTVFKQKNLVSGLQIRPFKNAQINFDYQYVITKQDNKEEQTGYATKVLATYSPIQKENFKVSFSYTRDENWGRNFNAISNTLSEQGNGNSLQTVIVDRNDCVEVGSLVIQIKLPINNPVVESFMIEGEGYLKKINDRMDHSKADAQKQSYEISGLFIKGTLFF